MKKRYFIICFVNLYAIYAMAPFEESFDSGDLRRLFRTDSDQAIATHDPSSGCCTESPDVQVHDTSVQCEQSYEQRCLCRTCLGLCVANGLYTLGRVTPSEQYPVIRPIFDENEPDSYLEHGVTCLAAMCTIWTMPSGQADHSCTCGHARKIVKYLTSVLSRSSDDCSAVPRPVFMAIAEKKDN